MIYGVPVTVTFCEKVTVTSMVSYFPYSPSAVVADTLVTVGATARAGCAGENTDAKMATDKAKNAQAFLGLSLIGEESTPKSGKTSPHAF